MKNNIDNKKEGVYPERVLDTSEIQKKLERCRRRLSAKRVAEEAVGRPITHTYYGGWSMGYLEGKVAALEDILGV